jgi:Fe-S-cluster containining protein
LPGSGGFDIPHRMKPATSPRSTCSRCGTCCRKGGPSLHLEDRERVEQGVIHTRHLYTIRRGEWATDPVQGGLIRVDGDIIKIKGRSESWACRFLEDRTGACRIYADRPLECRLLECRDTARLEQAYRRGRLSRRDLLADVKGLWELIEDHERRCGVDGIRRLLERRSGRGRAGVEGELAGMVRYDAEIRRLMVSQGGLEAEMLDFLLGRPVEIVLRLIERGATSQPGSR